MLAYEILTEPRFAAGDVVVRDGIRYAIERVDPARGWIVAHEIGRDEAEMWDFDKTIARAREGRIIPAIRQLALPGMRARR